MSRQMIPSRLTREGRATVPAAARKALGASAGDRLVFIVDGDQVRIVSADQVLAQTWANNHGGDAGDSVADVRAARERDADLDGEALARIDADVAAAEDEDPQASTAALLEALGFER